MKTPKGTPVAGAKNTPRNVRTPAGANTPKNAKTPAGTNTPKNAKTPAKQGQSPVGPKGVQKTPASNKKTPKNTPGKNALQKIGKENIDGLKKGSQTPQPVKGPKTPVAGNGKVKTPKSAPPGDPKRKKLSDEMDEEISDEEFEKCLKVMEVKKKQNGMTEDVEEDDDDEDDSDMEDSDDLDDLEMDDDSDDDDEDDDDEEVDSEVEKQLDSLLKQLKAVNDNDDDDDEEEEDESEDNAEAPNTRAAALKGKAAKKAPSKEQQKAAIELADAPLPAKEQQKVEKKQAAKEAKKVKKEIKREEDSKIGITEVEASVDKKRQHELDLRTLFLKNLAPSVTEEDIRALSSDILDLKTRYQFNKRQTGKKERPIRFSMLYFRDEKAAERNFMLLKGKQLKDKDIDVDYMGAKSISSGKKKVLAPNEVDPKKLYITGFNKKFTKKEDLMELFPTCLSIHMPVKDGMAVGFAFAFFDDVKTAKDWHDRLQGKKLNGRELSIMYAKKSKHSAQKPVVVPAKTEKKPKASPKNKRKAGNEEKGEPVGKKAKVTSQKKRKADDDEDDSDE